MARARVEMGGMWFQATPMAMAELGQESTHTLAISILQGLLLDMMLSQKEAEQICSGDLTLVRAVPALFSLYFKFIQKLSFEEIYLGSANLKSQNDSMFLAKK